MNTSVSTPWKDEFAKRVAAFAEAIGVEKAEVLKILAELGANGETEQSLTIIDSEDFLPMQDLFKAFVDSGLTKKSQVRLGVTHLRGKTTPDASNTSNGSSIVEAVGKIVAGNKPKSDWTDTELLAQLDEDTTEIAQVLSTRTKGRPCIIFLGNGVVNVEASLPLVRLAKRQPTHDTHSVGGKLVRVFRAGKFLDKPIDESPIYPGEALVDGYCAKSGTYWNDVSHEARVLIRLQVTKVEYNSALSKRSLLHLCVEAKKGAKSFRVFNEESAMLYDELAARDELPKLKIFSDQARENRPSVKQDSGF